MKIGILTIITVFVANSAASNFDTHCFGSRKAIVHLFEWRWADIAAECERFLGPKGFCGVQTSPPNENRVVRDPPRPWWERYQPVSYKLYSRSGDEAAFRDMVTRCNNVGVRIYVDALLNHMAGSDAGADVGIAGTSFNSTAFDFPGVPYTAEDFNQKGVECTSGSGGIESWTDHQQVRDCSLVGLTDLKQSRSHVREMLKDFLNDLTSIGVAGFRLDAAKHMWPDDIKAIADSLDDLPTTWFNSGSKPYIFQEVIDLEQNGEVQSREYYDNGRVTEFNYGRYLSEYFRGGNGLSNLKWFGEGYAYLMPSDKALVFIDNHDNQRGHGGGGNIITFRDGVSYVKAVVYMLAWPYGHPRIMSSYDWNLADDWQGPPSDEDYNTKEVTINADGSCGNDWICEHRWRPIANMARFSGLAGSTGAENWWDDGWNQIAFSRGNKAFIAINGDGWKDLSATLQTGMSAGLYCDIITGEPSSDGLSCTGNAVQVGSDGRASIYVSGSAEYPIVAFHSDSKISDDGGSVQTTQPPGPVPTYEPIEGYARTVVFIHFRSTVGQDLFVRGGISSTQQPSCRFQPSDCYIPIKYDHISYTSSHYDAYNAWLVGDSLLDWNGAESGQGSFSGEEAEGSPMVWTTNDGSAGGSFNSLNTYGEHYWMLDVSMDCSSTNNGWFELKAILDNAWESNISQVNSCSGTAGGVKPFSSNNHIARCGFINIFRHGSGSCRIDAF